MTLTTSEAARRLGISVQAVAAAVRRGRLVADVTPNGYRIRLRSVLDYEADRKAGIRRLRMPQLAS